MTTAHTMGRALLDSLYEDLAYDDLLDLSDEELSVYEREESRRRERTTLNYVLDELEFMENDLSELMSLVQSRIESLREPSLARVTLAEDKLRRGKWSLVDFNILVRDLTRFPRWTTIRDSSPWPPAWRPVADGRYDLAQLNETITAEKRFRRVAEWSRRSNDFFDGTKNERHALKDNDWSVDDLNRLVVALRDYREAQLIDPYSTHATRGRPRIDSPESAVVASGTYTLRQLNDHLSDRSPWVKYMWVRARQSRD